MNENIKERKVVTVQILRITKEKEKTVEINRSIRFVSIISNKFGKEQADAPY